MENGIKLQVFKENLIQEAEEILLNEFPSTIETLNSLLKTRQFKIRNFKNIQPVINILVPPPALIDESVPPPSKRGRFTHHSKKPTVVLPTGSIPVNQHVVNLIDTVKPHVAKLMEDAKLLKMWILLMIPKIEDGNNFGVQVQEESLVVIHAAEENSKLFSNSVTAYFIARATLARDLAKYPHVEDYRRAIAELDEREYHSFCLVLTEVRNCYCDLHDVLVKNLERIKKPRGSNNIVESLY